MASNGVFLFFIIPYSVEPVFNGQPVFSGHPSILRLTA